MPVELADFYKGILTWLIPAMLVWAIHYLAEISKSLSQIKAHLAVVVTKIDNHEHRISRLENKFEKREVPNHLC